MNDINSETKREANSETKITKTNRETMEVDLLIIGGGTAGLTAAYSFMKQTKAKDATAEPMVVVLEKGVEIGAHSFSGSVMKVGVLKELFPDFLKQGCPIEAKVKVEEMAFLTEKLHFSLPFIPKPFHNLGNAVVSISKFNRWLGQKCEELGVNLFPGIAAKELMLEGDKVVGVITGDKGLNKFCQPKPNFEPGLNIKAKLVIFAEGTRGSLFQDLEKKLNLRAGKNPEVFEEGVKEVIQMPKGSVKPGVVVHTLGWPLSKSTGGSFLYTLANDQIALGLVMYLDSQDPLLDPHRELQKLKAHPYIQKWIKGGEVVAYGAKTLPAGGWYSMPKLFGHGFMVCGDSASMVDVQRLKGIHLAMKSGMLAAEVGVEAMATGDFSAAQLKKYQNLVEKSVIKEDLWKTRNFHQALSKGWMMGLPLVALQELTGGKGIEDPMVCHKDSETTDKVVDVWGGGNLESVTEIPKPDGKLFFDKLGSVFLTGTSHDEDSPNHLKIKNEDICRSECEPKYKAPCNHFCPAAVYEMVDSPTHKGSKDLKVNFTNCIHCKTCDIKCPFENIVWTPPEGGGGPKYREV